MSVLKIYFQIRTEIKSCLFCKCFIKRISVITSCKLRWRSSDLTGPAQFSFSLRFSISFFLLNEVVGWAEFNQSSLNLSLLACLFLPVENVSHSHRASTWDIYSPLLWRYPSLLSSEGTQPAVILRVERQSVRLFLGSIRRSLEGCGWC